MTNDLSFFLAKPQLPPNYQETTWQKLKDAVIAIQTSKPISTSQEELYNAVQNLCSNKMAQFLYTSLHSLCESHVRDSVKQFYKYPFSESKKLYNSLCIFSVF